jgi:uncharacterized protein
MRIAVVADTHNRIPSTLFPSLTGADEIWHLGDVCNEGVLDLFYEIGAPMKVVRGNCDACLDWPLVLDLERAGFKIRLIHIPPDAAPPGVDLVLHGHTHVPRDETVGACRFLNPGCITRPNRGAPPSFAWLDLADGEPPRWRLQVLR